MASFEFSLELAHASDLNSNCSPNSLPHAHTFRLLMITSNFKFKAFCTSRELAIGSKKKIAKNVHALKTRISNNVNAPLQNAEDCKLNESSGAPALKTASVNSERRRREAIRAGNTGAGGLSASTSILCWC